ncbi:ABC transporter ATP-binding protein [Streptomyces enissocaesilis]
MISIEHLTKKFARASREVTAVDDVSFEVDEGRTVALLGPNGAGKTTLFRMLATLLTPTGGSARVAGADVRRDPAAVRGHIGYVGQMSPSPSRGLRAHEEIYSTALLQGLGRREARRRTTDVVESFDLGAFADSEVRFLSGGQRRRLDIAIGLVHEPRLVLLDEPTVGLDPDARAELWRHIRLLQRDRGATVLMSTHYLEEADALADLLLVLDHGRIVTSGAPRDLKTSLAGDVVTVRASGPGPREWPTDKLRSLGAVNSATADGDVLSLSVADADTALAEIVGILALEGADIASVHVDHATLDAIFDQLPGRGAR